MIRSVIMCAAALFVFIVMVIWVPLLMLTVIIIGVIVHALGLPINVTVHGNRVGRIIRFVYYEDRQ